MNTANTGLVRDLARLFGPSAVAFRREPGHTWHVFRRADLPSHGLPVGLSVLLAKPDAEQASSPSATRTALRLRLSLPLRMPAWFTAVLAALLAAVGSWGLRSGRGLVDEVGALPHFTDLAVAVATWAASLMVLTMLEAATVASAVDGNRSWFGIGLAGPAVEPVVWRLGLPSSLAATALALPAAAGAAALGLWQLGPAVALGVATGGFMRLVAGLYPLAPSPGSALIGQLVGTEDLPHQLRWSLQVRFLAPRSPMAGKTAGLAIAATALALWCAAVSAGFATLAGPSVAGRSAAAAVWRLGWTLALIGFAIWLAWRLATLLRRAMFISRAGAPVPVHPPAELRAYFTERSALMRHVPRASDLTWEWLSAPAGTFLVRWGDRDRSFYWLADGRAQVFARNQSGDPVHVATLGAGCGFGEIALLRDVPRTADVIIDEPAVLVRLTVSNFDAKFHDPESRASFADVVHAGQAISRSLVFSGLSASDRERWVAYGVRATFDRGEIVIREGDHDRWVGLVVRGQLAVERGGKVVATLGPDDVFGEIAYIEQSPRTATLRAMEPVLLWRWDVDWLDHEIVAGGLRDALKLLAAERSK